MRVGELIKRLRMFPPQLPVFFCRDSAGRTAIVPRDAVMNMVHPARMEIVSDEDQSTAVPDGFEDSLVVRACMHSVVVSTIMSHHS